MGMANKKGEKEKKVHPFLDYKLFYQTPIFHLLFFAPKTTHETINTQIAFLPSSFDCRQREEPYQVGGDE